MGVARKEEDSFVGVRHQPPSLDVRIIRIHDRTSHRSTVRLFQILDDRTDRTDCFFPDIAVGADIVGREKEFLSSDGSLHIWIIHGGKGIPAAMNASSNCW